MILVRPDSTAALLRDMEFDVVVDLAGWTGNASPALFASKIAPVQVNYLGFFASTGLPEMNYWIGDHFLFPDSTNEWSTEKLWRLKRCFIAWVPFDQLPEGRVSVPAAPQEMTLFSEVLTMSVSLVIPSPLGSNS